jgi:DNA-binding PadR family transcriptional regulator
MARRISSSAQALLGLLSIEPMSGYDLRQNIRASVGHIWSESYGQIYPNLKKLAASGLVSAKEEKQKGKPSRCLYSITQKGLAELIEWLSISPQPEIPRNELLLKLFFGSHVPAAVLIGYVERMVGEHRTLLEKFTRIEREEIAPHRHRPEVPFWRMTLRYGQLEMQAHLRWAEETLATLRQLDKQQKKHAGSKKEKLHARR